MATSQPENDVHAAMPRWVKVFGIIAIIVAVAFMILHLGGGGPGRHFAH